MPGGGVRSSAAGAAHIPGMAASLIEPETLPVPAPDYPPYEDGPYEVDSRIFTPEAMDEHDDYMAGLAVTELAA